MNRWFLLYTSAAIAISPAMAWAQNGSDIPDLGIAAEAPAKVPATTDAVAATTDATDEGFNIFSFFGFGKDKNKAAPKAVTQVQSGPQETKEEKLLKLAQNGDLNAQLALGYIYLYGEEDIKADEAKAFQYYGMAAAQNDNVALNNLASLYYSGIGTKQDFAKAAQLFQKAVQEGNTEAAVNLAFLYLSGSGVSKDSKEAMNYFVIAAKAGNPTAQFMLGYAYYKGFIVPQDYGRAFELLRASADAGYDDAQLYLAILYKDGQGIPQNYGKSVKYLQQSLRQGNLHAMMMLADMLTGGVKFTQDVYTAHVLYNLSSVRGAEGAAEKRDNLTGSMNVESLLRAQAQADSFREAPTEITSYVQQTFGKNIKGYIDQALMQQQRQQEKASQQTPNRINQ